MNLKKKKKGFTLIELMAVIAIIAILAAVLVPTVTGYIERSKKTAIITQVRNVVSAIETHNATAGLSDQINVTSSSNDTLSTVITKVGSDLLEDKSVSKLPKATPVTVLMEINSDTNSIKNMTLDKNGNLIKYGTTDITPDTVPTSVR